MDWAFFLPFNPQGKMNEHQLDVPSILTHGPTPEGRFQPEWLLTNPCSAACRPLGYSHELEQGQSHSGGLMSAGDNSEQATPNTNLGFSRTLPYHIRQGNGHLLLLHERQNTSDIDLLLIRLLKISSDNFLLCTESAGSSLLLLWQCESGRDVLLCPSPESLKDVVLGEWHGCPGLSKMIKSSLAATCLQLSWLPSQLKAEATR